MRSLLFKLVLGCVGLQPMWAHDHIEIGIDPADSQRLAMAGPSVQVSLFVPTGEPFSGYMPDFPGDAYASELTFSCEGNVLDFPAGALTHVRLVSVTGPAGGHFSFWDVDATRATWTRPVAWEASDQDAPALTVYEDQTGYGHIHGRAFTMDRPGDYVATFQAWDETGKYQPGEPYSITFKALATPALTIRVAQDKVHLTFTSRPGLTYDLQSSTTLQPDSWTTTGWVDGTGEQTEFVTSTDNLPRNFFRLVEYQ